MAGSVVGQIESDGEQDWSVLKTRLSSFQAFPRAQEVSAERLARAGFYFTGDSDRVRCFSCQKTVENWSQGDLPVERHYNVDPTCKFLNCVHRSSLIGGPSSRPSVSNYDEETEAILFSLNTGEVVDETQYPMVPHMKSEDARRSSFTDWPAGSKVEPFDLAQAGLFYTPTSNSADRVQCFCCGGMLSGWQDDDDPWTEHSKYYPYCFFILGHDVGNVPSEQPWTRSSSRSTRSLESYEERLNSFSDMVHPIDHERLAGAGFYSTGEGDRVLCFKCGGGLKDWQQNEDPWEEHAKHYPGCSFLLAEKGQEFVNSVQLSSPKDRFKKKVSNVMQSDIAQTALKMGFDPAKVERIILEKIRWSGAGYSTVEALIQDICNNACYSDLDVRQETDTEDPLKKLEMLQREKLCKVCMDSDVSVVFIPCGHLVTCQKCASSLSKCPICCASIEQKVKTYST